MNIEAEYNLCELKKELNAIEEYILGLRTPVEKYICDENGKITYAYDVTTDNGVKILEYLEANNEAIAVAYNALKNAQ